MKKSIKVLYMLFAVFSLTGISSQTVFLAASPQSACEEMSVQEFPLIPAAFMYVLPGTKIHSAYTENVSGVAAQFTRGNPVFDDSCFVSRLFTINSIGKNQIPSMSFVAAGDWAASDSLRREFVQNGADFMAKGLKTTQVKYYCYQGKNPFFGPQSSYNTRAFYTADKKIETVMQRFYFYRWTGETVGQKLDTYMIALDTQSGLVFAYAKISLWKEIFGHEMPVAYAPIDLYAAADGKRYAFYEYDPAGYVAADGSIVLYDWYIENTGKPLAEQRASNPPLGKSPYYGGKKISAATPFFPQTPVNGMLRIHAAGLKNMRFSGTSLVVGFDNAAFTYAVRADKKILTSMQSPVTIKKDTLHAFSGRTVVRKFVNETAPLTVELDSRIIKTNGSFVTVTDFREASGVSFRLYFDPAANAWKADDGVFELRRGETKELLVPLPQSASRLMELVYTVSWE